MIKKLVAILCVVGFVSCNAAKVNLQLPVIRHSKLLKVFNASSSNYPNISAHRGGKGLANYPENCLETLKYVSDSITAIYEVDVAKTKDGKLILMHDNSIDRTTNGSGLVAHLTYDQINSYNLVDDYGHKTAFKVPLFFEVLEWCKSNNVVLTIDIKSSVSQDLMIDQIRKANAQDVCIIITYNVAQAQSAYALAPELLLSVSARNHNELDRLLEAKIPTDNMIAFTGTRLSDLSLYKRLHDANIVCMLGTLGNLDKQAAARGNELYTIWASKGIDVLATDRPFEAFKATN